MALSEIFWRNIVVLPILLPFSGALAGLLFSKHGRVRAAFALTAAAAALGCGLTLWGMILESGRPEVFQVGGWPAPFGITLVADPLSVLFTIMSQIVIVMGIVYAMGAKDSCVGYPPFYPLFLFLSAGLTGGFLAGDLFDLFVFVELLAISSTVLTAISDDRFGVEAAYKYYYMSQLAAAFLLLAVGTLYVAFGTLNLAHLADLIAREPARPLLPAALALLLAAFMVKSATFPFHFWQPDFHTAAPTPVSAMLSSIVVKLGIYGFIRMTTLLAPSGEFPINSVLIALGIAGIVFGGLSAVGTYNVKRMLAYSTLAQLGFILVGIGWGTVFSMTAAIVFAFSHSLIKSAMLMLAGYVASRASVKSAAFEVVGGVGKSLPMSGVLFFIGGLGLVGVPPTSGFVGKLLLFRSGVQSEHIITLMMITAASIITLIYTTRAFQKIWWQDRSESISVKPYGDRLIAPAVLIGLVLLLGMHAEPLVRAALETSRWLMSPTAYIQAVLGG